MSQYHQPVLLNEIKECIAPKPGGLYVDATLGGGGHARMLLEESAPGGQLFGIDRDREAIEYATEKLSAFGGRFTSLHGNFADVKSMLAEYDGKIAGVLMDLGVSSHQLDSPRGFSFLRDEPLDMRMDTTHNKLTACEVVNTYKKEQLAQIIRDYGEERHFQRVTRAIVRAREKKKITTTAELAQIVRADIGRFYKTETVDACTRTFMAIRVFVNGELEHIARAIPDAVQMLAPGGRLAIISFHSLEDRIVKNEMRRLSGRCRCSPKLPSCQCGAQNLLHIITKKPICPGQGEIEQNPRARSAKLRCAQKL